MAKPSQREELACVSWEAKRRRHGVARQRGGSRLVGVCLLVALEPAGQARTRTRLRFYLTRDYTFHVRRLSSRREFKRFSSTRDL